MDLADQTVRLPQLRGYGETGVDVSLSKGERIWTESSYKYELAGVEAMGTAAGFVTTEQWIDEEARFALTLLTAA